MGKKYSVNMENDEVVSVEVDGVLYASPEEIEDEQDREQALQLVDKTQLAAMDREFANFDQEFEQAQRQNAGAPKLFLAIFLGIAALMLLIAVISAVGAFRRLAREVSAPAQVVDITIRGSRDRETGVYNEYAYPTVAFTLPGGDERIVPLGEGSWPPAYAEGDTVTVLYDPQRPNSARIQSFASNLLLWLLPGITLVVGLAFLGAALLFSGGTPLRMRLRGRMA